MMTLCMAFPGVVLRLLAELVLLAVASRLIRVDRTGGLLVGSGALLAMAGELGLPLLGWGGFFALSSQSANGDPFPEDGWALVVVMGTWFVIENLGPIGNALSTLGASIALYRLMGRVPEEAWDRNLERS